MFWTLLIVYNVAFNLVIAFAQSPSVVCIAGQCLQGYSNVTIGATLSADGAPATIHLLPGKYTTTTSPLLLHDTLSFPSAELEGSVGFPSGAVTLPMDFELQPGLAVYDASLYSGQPKFANLPTSPLTNSSIELSAGSLAVSSNVWAALSSNNQRFILWDSVPDVSELPFQGSLSLIDLQSSSCTTPCSSAGVCSNSGTCICPSNFNGSYCESCAEGFFGPTCQPCPAECPKCDQGITGSGGCSTTLNGPLKCNCINGVCADDGTCTCNSGWTAGNNGTACAQCLPGFYLTGSDCETCQPGCTQCDDGTGVCTSCVDGTTQDITDQTKCTTTNNDNHCYVGTFFTGQMCSACALPCRTCYNGGKDNCLLCNPGSYLYNGTCVPPDKNGVCSGTNGMIANNDNGRCEFCGTNCASCKIDNFSVGSTFSKRKCTACTPESFFYQNECISSCPNGTFTSSSQGNTTCSPCSSSCSTCQGSADFCLTCPAGQIASSGKCVSSCPPNTFSSADSCLPCHPDCSTCSGPSFNQCNSCPTSRLVLNGGRCLPTCSKFQFFDTTASTCQACDSSCSSCSGPGPSNCLACSSPSRVLLSGSCVPANCQGSKTVVAGLGVCLSDFVVVPSSSASGTSSPIPSISGLSTPVPVASVRQGMKWWQIFLMALGGLFIASTILFYWRRWARKQREKRTRLFAREKRLDGTPRGWRGKLARFGQRLFGLKRLHDSMDFDSPVNYGRESLRSPTIPPIQHDQLMLGYHQAKPHQHGLSDLATSYQYSDHSRQNSLSKHGKDGYPDRSNGQSSQSSYRQPLLEHVGPSDTVHGYPGGMVGQMPPSQSVPFQYPPTSYGSSSLPRLVGRYPSSIPLPPKRTFWLAPASPEPQSPLPQPPHNTMSYEGDLQRPSRSNAH